jgi:hypothetical protein
MIHACSCHFYLIRQFQALAVIAPLFFNGREKPTQSFPKVGTFGEARFVCSGPAVPAAERRGS